ncbi:MAG: hypothetical protein AAF899_16680 [Pseudomonadota bacterium]
MLHLAASRDLIDVLPSKHVVGDNQGPLTEPADVLLLGKLREQAIDAQLAPRVEPFHFCAVIEASPDRAAGAYLAGLLHVLPKAIDRPLLIRRPGAILPSFDEAWILGMVSAMRRDDAASLRFAIASRVERPFRRPLAFIIRGLADRLDEIAE